VISNEHRCIFIHQRKCAGISIMRAFGLITPNDPGWHYMNDGVLSPEYHHASEHLPDYYRFAIVRNPWDRFVSGWHYCENLRDVPLLDLLRNLPRLDHDYVHLTRPQTSTLYDRAGYLVVTRLARFELLQREFDEVCDAIEKPRVALQRMNATPRRPYQEYFYSQETRDLFEKHYYRDIDLLNYTF
jgi:hypothetical protein